MKVFDNLTKLINSRMGINFKIHILNKTYILSRSDCAKLCGTTAQSCAFTTQ